MPEFIPDYNKGLSDFHAEHNWIVNVVWEVAEDGRDSGAVTAPSSTGGRLAGIVRMRSGNPLTPILQTNRSRSLWSPSLGPGTGPDRPELRARPRTVRRGDWRPDPLVRSHGVRAAGGRDVWQCRPQRAHRARSQDGGLVGQPRRSRGRASDRGRRLEFRLEVFNLFNRANFGPPSLIAFAGTADGEAPLASFGQIRTTVTSSRQVQLGVRITF